MAEYLWVFGHVGFFSWQCKMFANPAGGHFKPAITSNGGIAVPVLSERIGELLFLAGPMGCIVCRRSGKACERKRALLGQGTTSGGKCYEYSSTHSLYRPIRRRHVDWRRSPVTRPTPWTWRRPSRCRRSQRSRRPASFATTTRAWCMSSTTAARAPTACWRRWSTTAHATWSACSTNSAYIRASGG